MRNGNAKLIAVTAACLVAVGSIGTSVVLARSTPSAAPWLVRFEHPTALTSGAATGSVRVALEVRPGTRVKITLAGIDITRTFRRSGERLQATLAPQAIGGASSLSVAAIGSDGRHQLHVLPLHRRQTPAFAMRANRFPASRVFGYDARLLRITQPAAETLVTGSRITLRMLASRGTRRLRMFVDTREVTPRLRRTGRYYTARLGAKGLRPGPHRLLVTTRNGRKRDEDAVTIFIGRRRRSMVALRTVGAALRTGAQAPVDLRFSKLPRRLDVTVNGHNARGGMWPLLGKHLSGNLSAHEGLRFGRNTLRVEAMTAKGDYDVETRVIRVPRDRPLAATGPNAQGKVGVPTRLDGSASRPFRPGDRLSYSWRIVRSPRGDPKLTDASSAHPTLTADRAGTYVIRLLVRERSQRGRRARMVGSSDTVTVGDAPSLPPIGWPINTLATQNNQAGISYGPNFAGNSGPPGSLQILVLDRTYLTTTNTPITNYYDLSSSSGVGSLSSELGKLSSSSLVILAGGSSMTSSTLPAVNQALSKIGVSALPSGSQGPFSAIGVPGAPAGTMFLNPRGALNGYIAQSFTPQTPPVVGQKLPSTVLAYTFVYGDYQPFSVSSSVNNSTAGVSIHIGNKNLSTTSKYPNAMYGLVVDAQTLQPLSGDTFDVNDPNPTTAASEITRLTDMLSAYAGDPFALVILQSVGTIQAYTGPAWASLSLVLQQYGATPHVVNTINGGYTFIGGPGFSGPPAETSTKLSGQPSAQLQGVLGMSNKYSTFQPVLNDPLQPGQGFNYSLLPIAYEAPQQWPHQGNAHYDAAYQWVNQQLGMTGTDMRTAYWSNLNQDWNTVDTTLATKTYAACPTNNPGFTQQVCQSEVKELEQEVQWVPLVQNLIANLQQPLNWETSPSYADLNAVFGSVEQSVEQSSGSVTPEVLDIISEGFDLLSYVSGEAAEPVLGVFGAATGLAGAMTTNNNGSTTLSTLQYNVSQLGLQLEDSYADTLLAYNQIEGIILSDYGKLSQIGQAIMSNDPAWSWSSSSTADAAAALEASTTRWSYGQLMPIAWPQWTVPSDNLDGTPVTPLDPWNWICSDDDGPYYYPFQGVSNNPDAWYLAYTGQGSPLAVTGTMWMLGKNTSSWGSRGAPFKFPSTTLTEAMNASFGGNLLLQAQFWARNFNPQPLSKASYFLDGCDF